MQASLAGKIASIECRHADLPAAASSIAEGAFAFAGQRCTANRRAIVGMGVYDRFLDELVAASARLTWGDPTNEQTQIGHLISSALCTHRAGVSERAKKSSLIVMRP